MSDKIYPGSYTIYKRKGAAQWTIMMPRRDDKGRISKNGAVLLEVAEGIDEKKYNWEEKISFAFGMSDLCTLFENPDNPQKLIHASPASTLTKTLEFMPGEGKYEGTFMLKLGEKDSASDKYKGYMVPISSGEYTVLLRLLMSAAPLMIGWQ
jgi:hypothetical protein